MNPLVISRTQKERFLRKFSEDDFRDQIVRPLLLLKGFKDGRDLCGPTEQGKDALFYEYDKLDNFELSAVQTKKGSINLAAKATDNITNLVAQLRTAANTAYALLRPQRIKLRPSKVYLVSSGKINDSARRHCVDEVRDTALRFLDSDDLIPWIDEHIPQLWLDIDANVLTYLGALEKQLAGHDGPFAAQFLPNDKTIANSCFTDSSVTVFVRRTEDSKALAQQRPRRGKISKKEESTFPLYAIPTKSYKKVLLLGDGGSGKTTGLLQTVYRTATSSLENAKADLVPVLVKAIDIVAAKPSALVDFLDERSRELSLQKKPVFGMSDLSAGRVCVFVDGLDEVGNQHGRELVVGLALQFSSRFPKCSLTISSRPYEFLADIADLDGFERLSMVPITWKDAERILDLARKGKGVSSVSIKESLSKLASVQGFALNPLMVSVYAATANFDLRDIPPNVTELFKRFTEQMLGRWDEQKGIANLHRPLVKDFATCSLAFHLHSNRLNSISKDDAKSLIAEKLAETGHHEDSNTILKEVLERSGLFRDFGNEIAFRHHMFQEFFAGRGIPSDEFAALNASDSWWRRAIVFYFGENPRNAGALRGFIANAASHAAADRFSVVCTVGLALQACYLSPVKTKIEMWKSVIESLGELEEAFIVEHDAEQQAPILTAFTYYFLLRDSLSLSNVSENLEGILSWIDSATTRKEHLRALTIFSLMRLARFDLISKADALLLTKRMDWHLIAVLELAEATTTRPLAAIQKNSAGDLRPLLEKGGKELVAALVKEVEYQAEKHKLLQNAVADRTRPKELPEQLAGS